MHTVFVDQVKDEGDTIAHWMGSLSASLRHFDGLVPKAIEVRETFSKAHRNVHTFLEGIKEANPDEDDGSEKNFRTILRREGKRTLN
jgi:hypothetical protein